jgi:protocatechuate 3,4-dioxygenase beta subunit
MALTLRAVAVLAAVSAAVAAAPAHGARSCQATPSEGVGGLADTPRLRAKIGTGHVLTGTVLSALTCRPVTGARVSFRQAGPSGQYGPRWTGAVLTNAAGRFRFQGPVPGDYGRGPHIHIEVHAVGFEPLAVTYRPRTGQTRAAVELVLVPQL